MSLTYYPVIWAPVKQQSTESISKIGKTVFKQHSYKTFQRRETNNMPNTVTFKGSYYQFKKKSLTY